MEELGKKCKSSRTLQTFLESKHLKSKRDKEYVLYPDKKNETRCLHVNLKAQKIPRCFCVEEKGGGIVKGSLKRGGFSKQETENNLCVFYTGKKYEYTV